MFEAGLEIITIEDEITVTCSRFVVSEDTLKLTLTVLTEKGLLQLNEVTWNKKTKDLSAESEDEEILKTMISRIQKAKMIGKVTKVLELAHLSATLQGQGVVLSFSEKEDGGADSSQEQGLILEESEETTSLDQDDEKINELRRSLTLRKGEEKWEDKFARQQPKGSR